MTTALVIEDHPDNMTLICDILTFNGYTALQATTGMQGYEMAQQKQPDFIILDIQLPDIDGYHVLDKIRGNELTRKIPVVAMTSYAMPGEKTRLLNAGCDGYVEKPIDPGQVMQQILQAIGDKT
jgi:two-component system cell cycle response regulator DivK